MTNQLTNLSLLDLRNISREGPTCTLISVDTPYNMESRDKLWIVANTVEIQLSDRNPGEAIISSRLISGATDFEHDSGYAFSFDVIGLNFVSCYHGTPEFKAYIKPGLDLYMEKFQIPPASYNPVPDADMCKECEEPHPIVPYLPDHNMELYQLLNGRRIGIRMGLSPDHAKRIVDQKNKG